MIYNFTIAITRTHLAICKVWNDNLNPGYNFESFLKTGTTFAVLSTDGKTPVVNCLPIASKFHFLEEILCYRIYKFGQKPYWSWERTWVSVSSLQKYCPTSFIWKMKYVYENILLLFVVSAIEAKKLLKVFTIS